MRENNNEFHKNTKLSKNIILTVKRQSLSIVLGLGYSIFLARVLGAEGNGKYALAMLFSNSLIQFLNLGIGSSNVYFIGRKSVSINSAIITSIRLWLGISSVGILAGIIFITFWGNRWLNGVTPTLQYIALFSFPISLLSSYLITILQGLQDFESYNKIPIFTLLVSLAVTLIAVGILKLQVYGVFIALNIANIFSLIILFCKLKPYWTLFKAKQKDKRYELEYISYGCKAHLSNILAFINYKADIYLVNYFIDPTAVGIYIIAVSIVQRLWIVSQATSTVILPHLSQLYGDENSSKNITPVIARYVLIVTLLLSIILALFSKLIINFFFGIQYISAFGCIIILLPGIVSIGFSRVFANDLAARGKPELNLYTSIIIVFINILFNVILIPKMGIQGAALATTIAYISNTVAKLVTYVYISNQSWFTLFAFQKKEFRNILKTFINFITKLSIAIK